MDDMKQMIRAVINGQHALKKELLGEMEKQFGAVNKRLDGMDKRFDALDIRLDKQGAQLAFLEDDAPTREEHDKLEKRVKKIEQRSKN